MTKMETLQINLDPNRVAAPAQRVAIIASGVVGTCLRALENDDLSQPEMKGGMFGYSFNGLEMSDDERRQTYQNWLLSKGFQDLARGIRETLEEAMLYLDMIKKGPAVTTLSALDSEISNIRLKAAKLMFPQLLYQVNSGLVEPMAFETEFASLQKARNCLEHRGGRVSQNDVDQQTGVMTLTFPRLRMFYKRGDEEVELMPGEVIDTHDPANPFGNDEEVPIFMDRVNRAREYNMNDLLIISSSDFFEIAMACQLFASDLAAKLPTLTIEKSK